MVTCKWLFLRSWQASEPSPPDRPRPVDDQVVSIAPEEIARLVRTRWRTYELRTGDRVLATFRRRGLLRCDYDVDVGGVGLSATVEWALPDLFDLEVAELVASVTHPGPRTVRVQPLNGGTSQTWVVSPPPVEGLVTFTSHVPWPGRPRVTVRARHTHSGHDTLVVVIGVCAVLAQGSLTFDVSCPAPGPR